MPMLPLVGSVMMPPGRNSPCASASQIIWKATRSFRLPPGLNISSLASTVASVAPILSVMRFSSTMGVRPISSLASFAQRAIRLFRFLFLFLRQQCLNHPEQLFHPERLAQEQPGLQAHAVQFPVVAAGDDDDRGVARVAMAAQNLIEGDAIKIGEANIQQDQVRAQVRQPVFRVLPIGEHVQTPRPCYIQHIVKHVEQSWIILYNRNYLLAAARLLEFLSHALLSPRIILSDIVHRLSRAGLMALRQFLNGCR